MRLETKAQIAKVSLTGLTAVASLIFLGVLVLVLCLGLSINPFRETTTSFLLALFSGLVGIASVLVLLNVASCISLIADAKVAELGLQLRPTTPKKWLIGLVGAAVVLAIFLAAGSYISKQRYLAVVHGQANEVLEQNPGAIKQIDRLLASGQPGDYKDISDIRTFLQNQRNGLPQLTIIYSGNFADKLAFYQVPDYFPQDYAGKYSFTPKYFPCTKGRDCEYLAAFFSGKAVDHLQKYTMRDDQFYIYIPITGAQSRFILFFNNQNSYGKFGS